MTGSQLDVTQRHPGVQGRHDERRPEHVRMDMAEACPPTGPVHPTMGDPAVEALSV